VVYCICGCSSRGLIEGMMVAGAGGLYPQLGWSNHSDETHLQYVCPFWVKRDRGNSRQNPAMSAMHPIATVQGMRPN
jgi:hypothetical protein